MTDTVCTFCGSLEHTAPHCPWNETPLRVQSRAASLAEAVVNTVAGLLIAMWATAAICWLHNIPMSWTNNFIITSWMTAISVARSYALRRAWNAEFWKGWKTKWRKAKLSWKYRRVDPDLCCCGSQMGQGGSICHHGGCRSAKEYAITRELGGK